MNKNNKGPFNQGGLSSNMAHPPQMNKFNRNPNYRQQQPMPPPLLPLPNQMRLNYITPKPQNRRLILKNSYLVYDLLI